MNEKGMSSEQNDNAKRALNQATASSLKYMNDASKQINKNDHEIFTTEVKNGTRNPSQSRKEQEQFKREYARVLGSDIGYGNGSADPYSNIPHEQRTSKKDVLSLSTASYGNSLLEKLVANSSHVEYQNAVLKFQEKQVELLSTIANTVVSMGKVIVTSEAAKAIENAPEYQRNVSKMAKALGSGDFATAASEGFGSIWKKVDRNGYVQLAQSMLDLFKGMLEDGKIKQIIKDKIKDTTLDILPFGLGDFFRDFEKDGVGGIQKRINQASVSSNILHRVFAKDFAAFNPITFKNQKLKTDYTEKAIFTKKTDKAITEIIPEYLAEILATLRKDEARLFDYNEDKYIGRTELAFREQKANDSKHWKTAMAKGHEDFKDMAEDVMYTYGDFHEGVKKANNVIFNGKGANGKLKFRDEKTFNNLMKRIFEKYGRDALDILTAPNMDPKVVANQLFGSDQASVQMYLPMIDALHALMSMVSKDRLREFDVEDFYTDLMDWDEDSKEARNGFTQRHTGNGSLGAYGNKRFEKGIRDFANKYSTLGQNNAAAWTMLKKMSMGDKSQDPIDNAINSENTYINTNVVYLNTNQVIGGGRNKKGKGPNIPPWDFKFPGFKKKVDPADRFKDIMNESENMSDAQDMNRGDRTNYYQGYSLGRGVADGDFGAAGDQEEYTASEYKKYAQMMTPEVRKRLSAAWNELNVDSTEEEINKTLKARKAISERKIKWDAALQMFAVYDHAGFTKGAYERIHGPGTGDHLIPDPMWIANFMDKDGNLDEASMRNAAIHHNPPITFGGLDSADYYNKKRKEMQQDIKGDVGGSGANAAFNMLGLIYRDPQFKKVAGPGIATMAGLALGAVAKEKGIINSKFGLGSFVAIANALSFIPSVKKNMEMLMGPDSDVKGSSGFTNRQIALAKIMNKIVPLSGAGMAAGGWFKLMSKMGPAGMALGLVGMPFAGAAGYFISKGMSGKMGDWLFGKKDKDAGWFSKLGKGLGNLVPAKFKRLITGGKNDQPEWEVYAETLRSARPEIEKLLMSKHLNNKTIVERKLKTYDDYINALEDIGDDPEKADNNSMQYKLIKERVDRFISGYDDDGSLSKAVDRNFKEILDDNELKMNDKIDPRTANYVSRVDAELMKKYVADKDAGLTDAKTFEEYKERKKEEFAQNINDQNFSAAYDSIDEARKTFGTEDIKDIDSAAYTEALKAFNLWRTIPDDAEHHKDWLIARDAFMIALKGCDPDTASKIINLTKGTVDLQNRMMDLAGEQGLTTDEAKIEWIMSNPDAKKYFEAANKKVEPSWIYKIFNKDKAREFDAALGAAPDLYFMIKFLQEHPDLFKEKGFTARYEGRTNTTTYTERSDADADDLRKNTYDFINRARPDAEYMDDDEKIPTDDNSMNNNPNAGTGFTPSIKNGRVPKDMLSLLGYEFKHRWSMDDFSKTIIGGRSGNTVGCSVATMNNILHFLGLREMSTNTLAAIANLHINSTGVKFTFFKEVCRRIGLAYAVYNSSKNRFNHNFFNPWSRSTNVAFAVLLNNYNGSGHFVFCSSYKDGTLKMIDPVGAGREETISVNDIALRASIIISITKISDTTADRNFGSFGTGYQSTYDNDSDGKDIHEDDGVLSGMGTDTRSKLYGNRGQANAFAAKTSRQRIYTNRGFSADTAAILDKLTGIQSIITASAIVNANDKQQAKRIQSTATKIDPDIRTDAAALTNLTNSPEVVKGQAEENKAEAALERTANATEALAGKKPEGKVDKFRKYAKGASMGLGSMIKGLPTLLASVIAAGFGIKIGWNMVKKGAGLIKRGWDRFKENSIDNMMTESKDQVIDPNTGEVIDNGHFKDVSKAIGGGRDLLRYGRAGAFIMKSGSSFMLSSARFGANAIAKFGDKAAKLPGVGKLIQKFLGLPVKLCDWLLKSKLGKWLQEKGLTKTIEWFRGKLHKLLEKIAPKLSKKIAEKSAKKGASNIFKRLPGIGLTILLVQAFYAAYQGYKHAGQLLKVDDNKVSTGLRVKTMFAKLLYDVGPELLVALLKLTPGGFAGFALDIAIIVLKEMITWDVLVDFLGLGEELRQQQSEEQKDKAKADKIVGGINKEEKDKKYDENIKEKKEADANARSRAKGIEDGSEYGSLNSAANRSTANGGAYNGYGGGSDRSSTYGGFGGNSNSSFGDTSIVGGTLYGTSGYVGDGKSIDLGGMTLSDDTAVKVEITRVDGKLAAVYTRADGTTYTKVGGYPAWRYNNPGNIMVNNGNRNYIKNTLGGYIGEAPNKAGGMFAVFASEKAGYNAMVKNVLYGKRYRGKSVFNMFEVYAPWGHGDNNPVQYGKQAVAAVGADIPLTQLNEEQKNRLFAFIMKKEGYKGGVGKVIGNMKVGTPIAVDPTANTTATTVTKSDAAKVKNPAGLLESDISTPSKKSAYTNAKGITESDISVKKTKAQMRGDDTNYKAFDAMLDKKYKAKTPSTTVNNPTPVANVVANAISTDGGSLARITDAVIKSSNNSTVSIVTSLSDVSNTLKSILNAISNNNVRNMRDAAAGAR